MPYFFCRLVPPRPTFPLDATEAETAAMAAHAAYWLAEAGKGTAIAFGPVFEPPGAWGLGVAEADDAEAMRKLTEADPVILAGLGFRYDIHPMPSLILRDGAAQPKARQGAA